jgi:tetratricopeptide (TPR) repeat protein/DNA-binding CsgD family transcriptional regulator
MKKASTLFTLPLFALILIFCGSGFAQGPSFSGYRQYIDSAKVILESSSDSAIILLKEALRLIDPDENPLAASESYFNLGEAYYFKDELDSTIAWYEKAVATDRQHGLAHRSAHITLLGNLGYSYDHKDQKSIALDYYEQALALARQLGDSLEIAANLANIGQLKTLMGDYAEAIKYMEEALAFDRRQGDETIVAIDLNTIGRIYESWGMFDKAVQYLEEALEIDRRLGNTEKMAIRYNSLGLTYKNWKKYEEALTSFRMALEIDRELGKADRVALRVGNIGSTYLAMGQAGEAIRYLERSLAFFRENQMPSYQASSLSDLGKAYFLTGDYRSAEKALLECIEISKPEDFNTWRMSALATLSEVYAATGREKQSLAAFREFVVLKDSAFSSESQKKIAEFQVKYDLFKKQQENEILIRDREITRSRQRTMILIFSFSALFLTLLTFALSFRLKIQQNRRLIAEQENKLLKMDLEQRNKELTYNAMCIIKNNETLANMVGALEDAIGQGDNHQQLRGMIYHLQNLERDKSWKEFEIHFVQTHKDFYEQLQSNFPDLTPNEKKLCAFLRLNMSTKDIASITHQSVHSINVARTRLRKKLGIDGTDENLGNFLSSL